MRAAFSVVAGMIEFEPTIEWLPRLSPQSIGSEPSDHYRLPIVVEPSGGATPIDPGISVIVSALTLASRMAGFGRCPLDVLRPSFRTYIQARPVYMLVPKLE